MRRLKADILVVGAGAGGVPAAIAAAEAGFTVVLTEPTDWIGGQFTAQAVPPDEHRWIEEGLANRSYLELRSRVRRWYREHRNLTPEERENPKLNPGNGWVSHLCAEPRVFHAVLEEWLAPHVAPGKVTLLLEHEPVDGEVSHEKVRSITLCHTRSGEQVQVEADYVLDATELGDLYPLLGVEHSIGAEHKDEYGEMHGRTDRAEPLDQQAFSWCFAIEHRPGENHTITRPGAYERWKGYVPRLASGEPPWTGPLFSWTVPSHNESGRRTFPLIPWPDASAPDEWEMWRYRRIVDRSIYAGRDLPPDVSLVNWVQMDYWQRPLLGVSAAEQQMAYREAREQSLCWLYWMQTDAPRHDGSAGSGYPGLRLRGDELGTADGFAKAAYIREPRRLLARTMVTEAHIGVEQGRAEGRAGSGLRVGGLDLGICEQFPDSIATGHYSLDLHPSCAGRNSVYVPAAPFRVPLGSLIPRRVENLLAAGKGIGVSHIANGCYRMHHVEWGIGEAAGALAAWCLAQGKTPAQVHESPALTREFQAALAARGVQVRWPWEP